MNQYVRQAVRSAPALQPLTLNYSFRQKYYNNFEHQTWILFTSLLYFISVSLFFAFLIFLLSLVLCIDKLGFVPEYVECE